MRGPPLHIGPVVPSIYLNERGKTQDLTKKFCKKDVLAMESGKKAPPCTKNEADVCNFVCVLLKSKGFTESYSWQIGFHAWRRASCKQMSCSIRKWLAFCDHSGTNKFGLKIKEVLAFLQHLFDEGCSYRVVNRARIVLVKMRKLVGLKMSPTDYNYLNKFLRSCFNLQLPIAKLPKLVWDINDLLRILVEKWPDNSQLEFNKLAGKVVLVTMIVTMCRRAEIDQMKLSQMVVLRNGNVKFRLPQPVKTFNTGNFEHQSRLQFLMVPRMWGNNKLCPVLALHEYITRMENF